jgi:CRISPR-associated protein Cas5t
MRVARLHLAAPTASFRYPHFLVGRQATYDMPPPSTIYGHIASAVGRWLDPAPLEFGYTVTHLAKTMDLEHQHVVSRYPPEKLSRRESAQFKAWRAGHPLSTGGTVQPVLRDFLFNVELTLYLTPSGLAEAFRDPVFPVVLGRSQDLACIVSVEEMDLEEAPCAYFSATLLPFEWRQRMPFGTTVLMPRFVGPPPEREPTFAQYIVLSGDTPVYGGSAGRDAGKRRLLRAEGVDRWWVDPASEERQGGRRGIVMHRFVD